MSDPSTHVVIVTFRTTPEIQPEAERLIGDYIADFLSLEPGFIRSRLLSSRDGTSIVHDAEWESEALFQAAGQKARARPDLAPLLAYEPSGVGYRITRTFPSSGR